MPEKVVELQPGESKVVSFEVTPKVAKTYQVSVNGLMGTFKVEPISRTYAEIVKELNLEEFVRFQKEWWGITDMKRVLTEAFGNLYGPDIDIWLAKARELGAPAELIAHWEERKAMFERLRL